MERVEEEVRLQLHLERLELRARRLKLRLRERRFEAGDFQLLLLMASVVVEDVGDEEDGAVAHEARGEVEEDEEVVDGRDRGELPVDGDVEHPADEQVGGAVRDRDEEAGEEVYEGA